MSCGARTINDLADPLTTEEIEDAGGIPTGPGVCRSGTGSPKRCPAGAFGPGRLATCVWSSGGYESCTYATGQASNMQACGAIFCISPCSCADARNSVCGCAEVTPGPLPPPDLPLA